MSEYMTESEATYSHHSAYADVLEHTSHTPYINDIFPVSSSSVMHYLLIRLYIKGNAGLIANVLENFYNIYSVTLVLYSFWKADDYQICWGAWEQSS